MTRLGLSLLAAWGLSLFAPGSADAVILGFHDVSDPVKSAGWACASDSASPLRVHLYAETPGGLQWIDSQLADQRRGDLPFVCDGAAHAFRFADYAANGRGSALYDRADPIPMHVFAETDAGLIPIGGSPRLVSFPSVGLWDPGLINGRWRTDFDNPHEGSALAPLLLGTCPFDTPVSDGYFAFSGGGFDALTHCRYNNIIFPHSNAASSDGTWPRDSYWAIIANVEAAMDNPLCVNGPPGQSLPVTPPGSGEVFGVIALPDTEAGHPERRKFHLVLNSRFWESCRNGSYGGPYLAFAAQADRGNNGVITYLNRPGAATVLRFGMTLMDIAPDDPESAGAPAGARRYSQAHLLVEAMWGGVKRWIFIELVPDVRLVDGTDSGRVDVHIRFNWHMANSMLYPGADYLFKSATVLSSQCAAEGVAIPTLDRAATYVNAATRDASRRDYAIDLQGVFDCVNRRGEWGAAAMPAHAVPVTSIVFGTEQDDRFYLNGAFTGQTAPNALWIAVDSIRIE